MPRRVRELEDGGIYHVFNRGNDRRKLFGSSEDFQFFLEKLLQEKLLLDVKVYHYCLMTNHFHLLFEVMKGQDLPKLMHRLQLAYARYFKKKYDFQGHVFQERFRSPRIPRESYYLQCGRYIERNPLKAQMVVEAHDYPYSSARYYACGHKDPLITPNVYYELMGATGEQRQISYRDFLSLEDPYTNVLDETLTKV